MMKTMKYGNVNSNETGEFKQSYICRVSQMGLEVCLTLLAFYTRAWTIAEKPTGVGMF